MVGNKCISMFVFILFPFFVFSKNLRLRHMYPDDKNEVKIDLIARSYNGDAIDQVEAGRPFLIETIVQGPGSFGEPKIQNFNGRRTGVQVKTVNGDTTARYSYHVVAKSPGILRIGPAVLDTSSKQYESNILEITVGEVEKGVKDSQNTTAQNREIVAELFVDKTEMTVGEKIRVTLRYYGSEQSNIQKIIVPEMADFEVIQTHKPSTRFEEKNGYYYELVEWSWDVYPKKAGNITIPAYALDLFIQGKERNRLFGFPSFFSGFHGEHKRIYSNAVTLAVNPLPSHNGPLDAVGNFISFELRVNKKEVTMHDAVVATLELVGDPVETVDSMRLKDMPESVRWYESKNTIKDGVAGLKKRCWEFIIQPLESGTFLVPPQKFSFFDTTENRYRVLESHSIPISIAERESGLSQNLLSSASATLEKKVCQNNGAENGVVSSICLKMGTVSSDYRIPHSLFFVIIVLIFIGTSYKTIRSYWQKSNWYQSSQFQTKVTFRSARNTLKFLEKNKKYERLYRFFEQLIIAVARINKSFEKETSISIIGEQIIKKRDLVENWKHFLKRIEEIAFFPRLYDEQISQNLFQEARFWLDYLEKGLK